MKGVVRTAFFFIVIASLYAPAHADEESYRGWGYVVSKLRAQGISEELLTQVYGGSLLPEFQFVPYSLKPRETHEMYEGFTSKDTLRLARSCGTKYKPYFKSASRIFGVGPSLITAILVVETRCGEAMGKDLVVNRLSRLAALDEAENIRWNVERLTRLGEEVTLEGMTERAKYLNATFFPELLILFREADTKRLDVLRLRGSSAGAFGMSQFLPSTYLKYGVDGDKDGSVSLFRPADAIWSIAYFFAAHGWRDDLSEEEKRKIIWRYNKSEPYIDAVLRLSGAIG